MWEPQLDDVARLIGERRWGGNVMAGGVVGEEMWLLVCSWVAQHDARFRAKLQGG
jgi:hypothetical protein